MSPNCTPEIFRQLADKLSYVSEEGFFHHLVMSLADMLKVDHAVVEHVDNRQHMATTLAAWSKGAFREIAPYPLDATPSQRVARHSRYFVASQVRQQFASDDRLTTMHVDGYLGIAITAPDGGFLGVIALMHSSPLVLPIYTDDLLRIASALAGAELARQVTESQTQERLLYKKGRCSELVNIMKRCSIPLMSSNAFNTRLLASRPQYQHKMAKRFCIN